MAVKVRQKSGKWWVFIDHDHHGKRKAKCIGDNKRTAQQVAEKIQAKIALGQFEIKDEQPSRPFAQYFQQWIETYACVHCKPSSVDRYQRAFRAALLPAFGNKDISTITRDDIKKMVYDLHLQKKSRNTIKATLTPLGEMFNHAVEDGHIAVNPALRILRWSRADAGEAQHTARFLTQEEAGRLLATCKAEFSTVYPFISLLVKTGLRTMGGSYRLAMGRYRLAELVCSDQAHSP